MSNQQPKRLVTLRITDLELHRALKTLSREPKEMGYTDQRGSVAGVITKFLSEHADHFKQVAERARSGFGVGVGFVGLGKPGSAHSVSRRSKKKRM
jgi:hypothetical protein